jgi:hypothetical protein
MGYPGRYYIIGKGFCLGAEAAKPPQCEPVLSIAKEISWP